MRPKYPDDIKGFAMTLHYYSARVYKYVRQQFNSSLPHPRQIRRWYTKVVAEPGFTQPSFTALQSAVKSAKENQNEVLCALTMDEMSIKKLMQWDGNRFRGFVDLGTGLTDSDSLPQAREVLVFMVVGVNFHWKIPCGYFFIDGLSGVERASLVTLWLKKMHDVGVRVVSLTCDAPTCNIKMFSELGANYAT